MAISNSASQRYLVVIAGGSGTRFWPKSTSKRPKQLLGFGKNPQSLLTQTFTRFETLLPSENNWVLTTQALDQAVKKDVAPLKGVKVLAEPQGRNTAPCVYWAAQEVAKLNPKAVIMIMPADHYIADIAKFRETVSTAAEWAATHDDLVTLGIKPTRPETGYGYLKVGGAVSGSGVVPKKVDAFVEKPNAERAQEFLSAGNYLWNGGMFLWRAEVILRAFDEHMPEMRKAWEASSGNVERAYPLMTATSIDYGVMEKAKNVVSFELNCGWDDLGSWTSLEEMADVLEARQGSNIVSAGEVIALESRGNVIDAPNKVVALLGVEDLVVVDTGTVLMVAHKSRAQDIKKLVEETKAKRPDLV